MPHARRRNLPILELPKNFARTKANSHYTVASVRRGKYSSSWRSLVCRNKELNCLYKQIHKLHEKYVQTYVCMWELFARNVGVAGQLWLECFAAGNWTDWVALVAHLIEFRLVMPVKVRESKSNWHSLRRQNCHLMKFNKYLNIVWLLWYAYVCISNNGKV